MLRFFLLLAKAQGRLSGFSHLVGMSPGAVSKLHEFVLTGQKRKIIVPLTSQS